MNISSLLASACVCITRMTAVCLLGGLASVSAATLTGVVKKPDVPHEPAPSSTVSVYDAATNRELFRDTTGKDGRYRFKVAFGTSVVVRATWRADASMPGTTKAFVADEPTTADVFLQPKKTSSTARWFAAGSETAKRNAAAVDLAVNQLWNDDLPAESLYEFIQGARSSSPDALDELGSYSIFSIPMERSADRRFVTAGLKKAGTQLKSTGTIPTFVQLRADVDGPLSEKQYVEMIGLLSPPQDDIQSVWKSAVRKSVDPGLQGEVLDSAARFHDVFEQQNSMQSASAGDSGNKGS